MTNQPITILGAGFSGLSCAYHYPGNSIIYEAQSEVGGTASSLAWQDFVFDYGPHISFTKNEYIKQLLAQAVNDNYLTQKVKAVNYYKGSWLRHPAICNLGDLPPQLNRNSLISFLENKNNNSSREINNYKEWCEINQGQYFAEHFTHAYTRKFWTVEPEELTYQWAGARVAKPSLERVVDGALNLQKDTGHYFTEFRYPQRGGYGAYRHFWQSAKDRITLKLNHRVTAIDLSKKQLWFQNGSQCNYGEKLISSLPLPDFVHLVKNAPLDVQNAVQKLRHTSIALVNLAINSPPTVPYHLCYLYDSELLPPRVTFYSNLSAGNAPLGCSALQAEVPYSPSRPLPTENVVERVIQDLAQCGIIDPNTVLHGWQVNLKYAYVIFDHARDQAVTTIHTWMREQGVEPIGRFGLWQYLWSDGAIQSGRKLAKTLLEQEL